MPENPIWVMTAMTRNQARPPIPSAAAVSRARPGAVRSPASPSRARTRHELQLNDPQPSLTGTNQAAMTSTALAATSARAPGSRQNSHRP